MNGYNLTLVALVAFGTLPVAQAQQTVDGKGVDGIEEVIVAAGVVGVGTVEMERDPKDTRTIRGSPYTLNLTLGYKRQSGRGSWTAQIGYSHRGRIYNWSLEHNDGDTTAVSFFGTNLLGKQ